MLQAQSRKEKRRRFVSLDSSHQELRGYQELLILSIRTELYIRVLSPESIVLSIFSFAFSILSVLSEVLARQFFCRRMSRIESCFRLITLLQGLLYSGTQHSKLPAKCKENKGL